MKRHWLITAFEPFAERGVNNSQNVLNELTRMAQAEEKKPKWPFQFHFFILPTKYDLCFEVLKDEVARLEKDGIALEGILSLGEGSEDFKIETQANNLDDVPNFPDNAGVVRVESRIFKDLKDDLIPLRFPVEAFLKIRKSGSPGFFVCNHLCARAGRTYGANMKAPLFGFIHVPKTDLGGIFTPEVCANVILMGFDNLV